MKRIFSILASLLIVFTIILPSPILADEELTAGELKTGLDGDKIIMGEYNGVPVRWQVIEKNHYLGEGLSEEHVTLWSEYAITEDSVYGQTSYYLDSNDKKECDDLYQNGLKDFEKEAVLATGLTASVSKEDMSKPTAEDIGEHYIYILSNAELGDDIYGDGTKFDVFPSGLSNATERIKKLDEVGSNAISYYTRSGGRRTDTVVAVGTGGNLAETQIGTDAVGLVPACNIKADTPVYLWDDGYYRLYPELISISLNKTSKELTEGEEFELEVIYNPTNVREEDKGIVWSSNDPSIATVDPNGKVTALKEGTVTITATSEYKDTITASCTITISAKQTTPTDPDDDKPSSQSKPEKVYDPDDANKDGVVTCEEKLGSGWIWSEDQKACIRQELVIVDTSVK